MPCCGGSGSSQCSCKIEAGSGITITGTGTAGDPFILTVDAAFEGVNNQIFNVSIIGSGAELDPYQIEVTYALTAKLDDIPDVQAPAPTNGQVLGWDNAALRWTPRAPTSAAAGSVDAGEGLIGDGSVGFPLAVNWDGERRIWVESDKVGLTDLGMAEIVQHFVDAAQRDADIDPPPLLNQITTLDTAPGQFDYFDGTIWRPIPGLEAQVTAGTATEWLAISGGYIPGMRTTRMIKQVSATTDGTGLFDILDSTDLTGYAGVLSVEFQEDEGVDEIPFTAILSSANSTNNVAARAYRLDDGAQYPGQAVTGTCVALLY
jgi:hypothetical protein